MPRRPRWKTNRGVDENQPGDRVKTNPLSDYIQEEVDKERDEEPSEEMKMGKKVGTKKKP